MPQIHVVFPATGKPIILNDAEICPRREPVTWCFHSANPEIETVEVEFEREEFFPETPKTPRSRREPVVNGSADFYGHVPDYQVPLSAPKIAKYTVRGYDSGGRVVSEDDPVIITTEP